MIGRRSFQPRSVKAITSEEKATRIARLCDAHKGQDIEILKVGDLCSFTDYMVLISGLSTTHLRALAEIHRVELKKLGVHSIGVEGGGDANWILTDYGDVVAHVFLNETRRYYNLERLWGDATRLEWRG